MIAYSVYGALFLGLIVLSHYGGSLAWPILLGVVFVAGQVILYRWRRNKQRFERESDELELEQLRARLSRLTD